MITLFADPHGFFFGVYSVAAVDVVNTISKPDTAISIVGFYSVDCFSCGLDFDALGGNLPTAFVGDDFAVFKGKSIIVVQFVNAADVNHFVFLSLLVSVYMIPHFSWLVNVFLL